jgi:hypothetical protein
MPPNHVGFKTNHKISPLPALEKMHSQQTEKFSAIRTSISTPFVKGAFKHHLLANTTVDHPASSINI